MMMVMMMMSVTKNMDVSTSSFFEDRHHWVQVIAISALNALIFWAQCTNALMSHLI